MSRKSKHRTLTRSIVSVTPVYLFVVTDSRNGERVVVAAPVFFQLLRRGWARQIGLAHRRDAATNQRTEEYTAVLVSRLSFRSLVPSPDGNICFRSLLESTGASIESSWRAVERAWAQRIRVKDFVPTTWQGREAVYEARQDAIWEECQQWGLPEIEPTPTGGYLQPELAELAILARQQAGR